jgi:NADH:ubiquinone oxidoreductase subunit F (NADH-binding)
MSSATTMAWPAPAVNESPGLPRLLPTGALDLPGHDQAYGPLCYSGAPRELIEEIRAAGLTGRGGAGFPAAVKMTAVAARRGRRVVVGNGAEGEPASHKDRHLLRLAPHLVLDGLQLAAEAVGARRAYLYVHGHEWLLRGLGHALAERSAARWDRIAVEIVAAPPRFLAGEESALASRVGGGSAWPTFKRPPVFERGVGGAPTLVQNVETLAHVALIARFGADWFRQVGTAAEPGSMLVTAHRADGASLVTEVPIGVPLAVVLGLGGQPVHAVLAGGYHGTWIPAAQAAALPLANAALRQAGASLGAGVLAALPPDRCGLAETARVLRYLAAESAGQCGPCLSGLPRMAGAFTELSRPGAGRRCLADLERWSGLVAGRGACHHPDGTVRLVRSALAVFTGEVGRHLAGRCTAWPPAGDRGFAGGPGRAAAPFLPLPAAGPGSSRPARSRPGRR